MATNPERSRTCVDAMVQGALRQHEAGISIHVGKTKIWNQAGVRPGPVYAYGGGSVEAGSMNEDQNGTKRVWRGP